MWINSFATDEQILSEIGARIKAARIRAGKTQARLATESGVSKRTVENIENGESAQFLNIIKILRALNLIQNLEALLPSAEKTPVEYVITHTKSQMMRVRESKSKKPSESPFKWGDEK